MITPIYLSLLAIIYLTLTFMVVRYRRKEKVGLGLGKDGNLRQAVRAHGNFAEYTPMAIMLMFFAELQNLPAIYLHILGVALILSRLSHAYGIYTTSGKSNGRFLGMVATLTIYIILIIFNLSKSYSSIPF